MTNRKTFWTLNPKWVTLKNEEIFRSHLFICSCVLFLVDHYLFSVGCSGGGIILWILQIDHPYFMAWSAGLSMIASALALIATLCLVPDIKEYPYEKLQVSPSAEMSKQRREKQTFYTKHGVDKKKNNVVGRDQPYRDPYVKRSNDLGHDYGRHDDPYVKNRSYLVDESDRFSLNVVTPSRPPRGDFFVNKPRY